MALALLMGDVMIRDFEEISPSQGGSGRCWEKVPLRLLLPRGLSFFLNPFCLDWRLIEVEAYLSRKHENKDVSNHQGIVVVITVKEVH